MYAVIKAGGKQQRVKPGDVIEVELMHGLHGESVTFSPLLVVDDDGKTHVGKDLGKATVSAKLVGEQKGEKVHIFKYRAKTGYNRRQGHRQRYTLVEIQDVSLGGTSRAKRRSPAKEAEPPSERAESAQGADEGGEVTAAPAPEPEDEAAGTP